MMFITLLVCFSIGGAEPAATDPPPAAPTAGTESESKENPADPSTKDGATGEKQPTPRPKKSLRKGDATAEKSMPVTGDDEAPAPESDRPIPKPGEEVSGEPSPTDEKLDEELGQDLEAANNPDEDPISRIAEGMKQSEEKLAQRLGDDETINLQEKIIKDIEELLAQAENPPPPGGGGGKQGKKKPNPGSKQQQQMQRQTASRGSRPSRTNESSERIGPPRSVREELKPQTGDRNVWGHLSEMMREEMGQYAKENFLVKYRDLIERYYTDIARQSTKK
jgi:hypothetical protein